MKLVHGYMLRNLTLTAYRGKKAHRHYTAMLIGFFHLHKYVGKNTFFSCENNFFLRRLLYSNTPFQL